MKSNKRKGLVWKSVTAVLMFVFVLSCTQPGLEESGLSGDSVLVEGRVLADLSAYQGNAQVIPGKIEAENYDEGANGVAYYDVDSVNRGGAYRNDAVDIEAAADTGAGHNIGWLVDGEWLNYTVSIKNSGTYDIEVRNASEGNGSAIHFSLDGKNIGDLLVANTGGWQKWRTDTLEGVTLSKGEYTLTLHIDDGDLNINHFTFIYKGGNETRPWQGVPAAVPGKIEAENFDEGPNGAAYSDTDAENVGGEYRTGDAVDIQVTTDAGAGYNVGWTADGEWMQYTINVTKTADYDIAVRNASDSDGSQLYFTLDGTNIGSLTLAPTEGWQNWRTDSIKKVRFSEGEHTLVLHVVDGSFNVNYINITPSQVIGDTEPYLGYPAPVPGKIEAENYDKGAAGKAYSDADPENQGGAYRNDQVDIEACKDAGAGYNIGWLADGEWLQYTINVTKAGSYDIDVRNASEGNGSTVHFTLDGADLGSLSTVQTGDWQTWQTDTLSNVYFSAGEHTLKLFIDDGDLNINYIDIHDVVVGPFTVDRSRGEWTLVVIPDTQHYPQNTANAPFVRMKTGFQWIVSVKDSLNIKMVQSLGDITNDWANLHQWDLAKSAWELLDGKVPYSVTVGNHDDPVTLNNYFPLANFRSQPWWGGDMGGVENSYQLFTIGREDYMFLSMETFDQYSPDYHPEYNDKRRRAMAWAKGVLNANPDRKVILATHDNWDTTTIREQILAHHGNIIMSNAGHTGARERHFVTYGGGGKSNNFITDYQHDEPEMMLIRYYIFKPMEDKVEYFTYSPVSKTWEVDESSQGSFILVQAD